MKLGKTVAFTDFPETTKRTKSSYRTFFCKCLRPDVVFFFWTTPMKDKVHAEPVWIKSLVGFFVKVFKGVRIVSEVENIFSASITVGA